MKEEKQATINNALAKLTEEEKELLGLIKKEKKPKVRKNYKLKVNYMIGDADGHTDEEAIISVNNPFLKIITNALDKLEICEGSWGLQLNDEDYFKNYESKNISKLECDLLCLVSGYSYDEDTANEFFEENNFEKTEENHDYIQEFEGLFIDDTEYSFLVYQGYKLK
ncbi:MAG: hypothetical protein AABY15_01595 [Nanoarchaeota archaeon]